MTFREAEIILLRKSDFDKYKDKEDWVNSKFWSISRKNNDYYRDDTFMVTIFKIVDSYRWSRKLCEYPDKDMVLFSTKPFESKEDALEDVFAVCKSYLDSRYITVKEDILALAELAQA